MGMDLCQPQKSSLSCPSKLQNKWRTHLAFICNIWRIGVNFSDDELQEMVQVTKTPVKSNRHFTRRPTSTATNMWVLRSSATSSTKDKFWLIESGKYTICYNLQDTFEFQCAMTRGVSSRIVTVTICANYDLLPECGHTLIVIVEEQARKLGLSFDQ